MSRTPSGVMVLLVTFGCGGPRSAATSASPDCATVAAHLVELAERDNAARLFAGNRPRWCCWTRSRTTRFRAYQASRRGGEIWCRLLGERVELQGTCVFNLEGRIDL